MPTVLGLRLLEWWWTLSLMLDENLLWRVLIGWQRLQAPSGHAEGLKGLDGAWNQWLSNGSTKQHSYHQTILGLRSTCLVACYWNGMGQEAHRKYSTPICLAMTGALRTTPMLEVFLDLPLLYLSLQGDAGAAGLWEQGNWTLPHPNWGHFSCS